MSLVPRFVYGELDLTDHPFAIEFGSDFGNPENVVDVVQTLLHDGEVLESTRRTNRTLTLTVLVEDADLLALATAEGLLVAECDKQRNTLSVEPGDGIGPTTVFETFRAQPRWVRDDDMEQQGFRRFVLEIPALPHPRSVDPITDDTDVPPAAAGVLLNSLDSATGWSSTGGGTAPTVDAAIKTEGAGSVRTSANPSSYIETFNADGAKYTSAVGTDTWVLSQAVTAGEWTSIKIRLEWPEGSEQAPSEVVSIRQTDSVGVDEVDFHVGAMDANGFVSYSWRQAASVTVTELRFYWQQLRSGWGSYTTPRTWYDALMSVPAGATGKQVVKVTTVEGSARAPVSLHVAAATDSDALGQVFLASMPVSRVALGFQPDSIRWIASGASVVDATAIHGYHYVAGASYGAAGSPVLEIPVATLTPGPYHVYAMVRNAADPLPFGVEAQLMADGVTATGPTSEAEVSVPNTDEWRVVAVGTVSLPPTEMVNPDAAAVVRLRTKGANTKVGEIFLVPATSQGKPGADVTIVDCGTGTVSASGASSHLWVEAPTAARRYGGFFRGPTSDGLNRRAVSLADELKKPGRHHFEAEPMQTYVAATGVAGVTVTPTYTPHWFGSAGR